MVKVDSKEIAIKEGRIFNDKRFVLNANLITRTQMRELKNKLIDNRNAIIKEVIWIALVLKDA